jgi:hypothetical protein
MKVKFIIPLLVSILFSGYKCIGQDSLRTGTWLSINAHYGFILPIYTQDMVVLLKGHCPAIEADYFSKPSGSQQWQQDYHYAETGVSFFYAWLGNPAQLGNEIGLYPFINFHLQRSNKECLFLRAGLGLAYLPVIFNQETNHKNILIGSHINAMINLRLAYHYYISNDLRLETGFGITHCSNGSYNTPNLGINLLTINTGLSYCIKGNKMLAVSPHPDTSNHKKLIQEFFIGIGESKVEPPGGPHYGAMTFSYIAYHTINRKNKIGGGLDVFYNSANLYSIAKDSIPIHSNIENAQLGVKVGYELVLGKLSLPYELGAYLYTKSIGHGYEYNRLGIRYTISKHFIANITLLAHYAAADYVEWGFGYKL